MNSPRTVREALFAETLGELNVVLARVDALLGMINSAEERLTGTVNALGDSGDKFRMAVSAFTEQAKADLSDYLDRKTIEITTKTVEEQRAAMQEAARMAFRSEASDKAAALGLAFSNASKEFRRSMLVRLFELAVVALASSGLTGCLVYLATKAH